MDQSYFKETRTHFYMVMMMNEIRREKPVLAQQAPQAQ
jgi:hypothetical protein